VRASVTIHGGLLAAGLTCAMLIGSLHAAFGESCKPRRPLPTIVLTDMGACQFDLQAMSFAGAPTDQAKCLMRGVDATRNLAPPSPSLPPALASRIGENIGLPSREALSSFLSKQDLEWDFAAHLWQPVSRARDNDPDAPPARYFVIHDTSGPNYHRRDFPDDIDVSPKLNNLKNFVCQDGWGKAHVVVNRSGDMLLDHDFAIPWRETKFERAVNFAGALKGLFLHTELIQPRQSAAGHGWRNDARTPDPAFSAAQYDRLALLYVIASVRADEWLIPAFHAAIDAKIPNGHDDPLNFDIQSFADSLDRLIEKLKAPGRLEVAIAAPAANAQPDNSIIPANAPWIDAQWDSPPRPSKAIATASQVPGPPDASAAQSLVSSIPNSAAMAASNRAPNITAGLEPTHAIVALHEHESSEQPKSATAERCQTRLVKGHRRRLCYPDRAERRERGRHAVRSVDRRISHQGHGARHYGGDLHARHAHLTSRHGRT
jgi:hypothetical protein